MSHKVRIRPVIVIAITLFFYIMLVYSLFFVKNIFQSLLFIFLFFISFHFFFLETKKYKFIYFLIWAIILSVVGSIIIWFDTRQYIASLFALNIWISAFILNIQVPLKRKIRFNSLSYFTIWWYIFTVFTTITYSFALIWMYSQFPFKCEDLSRASSDVVDFFTKPFKIWLDTANKIKDNTQSFFKADIQKTLWNQTSNTSDSKLTILINEYRERMINQVVADNKSINMWICDYVLWEINNRYNKPVFQFSLILLMYLLFYPFLRIIYRIMSVVWIVIFKILFWFKVYNIQKVTKEIEEIN